MTQHANANDREWDDQRSEGRTATVFRPVLIEAEDFAGFCLVRNLSSSGMMGHVYTDFAEDTPISLQFGPGSIVIGSIKWCNEGRIGVEFDEEISVTHLLEEMAMKNVGGKPVRAPRLRLQCDGELTLRDKSLKFELQDISQRGIKVRSSSLQPGDEVFVQLDGLKTRKAIVRWIQGGAAGLNFLLPLPFDELARWVIWRNSDRMPPLPGHNIARTIEKTR